MSSLVSRILENLATRLMFIIYLLFIVVTIFFIGIGYYHELALQEDRQYDKLKGIVSSLAISIDGNAHSLMISKYYSKNKKDRVVADSIYRELNKILSSAKNETGLQSPLYTLVWNEKDDKFYYGVRSDDFFDVNNEYSQVPELLKQNYQTGGTIPSYETENGTWISAFHPIKTSEGKVVALLEADIKFSVFKSLVNKQYLKRVMVSMIVIVAIFLIFIRYTRKILKEEIQKKKQLSDQKRIIEFKNKDIMDSMHYALKIQNKILPPKKRFEDNFSDFFIMYQSKDIVAGDFYWMEEINGEVYIAVADCTGHGVPGAILSIICANILDKVICQMKLKDPGHILDKVREMVISYLTKGDFAMNDGMDIALCRINIESKQMLYAGAYNPIYILRNNQLIVSKPNKQPVGKFDYLKKFESSHFSLHENDIIYLFSDGFADQFGGPLNKKFKIRNFREMVLEISSLELDQQKIHIESVFNDWKGDQEQIDDVCVIGVQI